MSEEEHTLRAAPGRRAVEEWALVLAAAGIAHRVAGNAGSWRLLVAAGDADRSIAALDAYDAERRHAAAGEEAPEYGPTYAGLLVAVLLVGFYGVTGPADPGSAWARAGSASAELSVRGRRRGQRPQRVPPRGSSQRGGRVDRGLRRDRPARRAAVRAQAPASRRVVARRRQPGAARDARLGPRSGYRGASLRPPRRRRARRGGGAAGRATARAARAVGARRRRAGGRRRLVAGGAARLVKRAPVAL